MTTPQLCLQMDPAVQVMRVCRSTPMHPGGYGHSPLLLLVGKPDHLHRQQYASQHAVTNKKCSHSAWQYCKEKEVVGGWGGRGAGYCT